MARKAGGGTNGRIQLKGFKELERKLKALPAKVAKKVVRQSLRAGAKIVQTAVKARVPVRTGQLRQSIKVRAAKSKKRGSAAVQVRTGAGDFKGETFFGAFIEYGYEKVPTYRVGGRLYSRPRGSQPTTTIPPRPYMRPGFDASKGAALAEIKSVLAAKITAAAKE